MGGSGARSVQVLVIGGGQAGLSVAYHLRRAGLAPRDGYVVLDADAVPGGSWSHVWASLRLFSPAEHSSLPGWPMPGWDGGFPPASHVRRYLGDYEQRYDLPVIRPVEVSAVRRLDVGGFEVSTTAGV